MTTPDTNTERGWKCRRLFSTIYGRYLRHAVVDTLMVPWEAVKDVHGAKLDKDGMENEERRALCENSERLTTLALWAASAEKLYSAMREKYFSESTTRHLRAVLES